MYSITWEQVSEYPLLLEMVYTYIPFIYMGSVFLMCKEKAIFNYISVYSRYM